MSLKFGDASSEHNYNQVVPSELLFGGANSSADRCCCTPAPPGFLLQRQSLAENKAPPGARGARLSHVDFKNNPSKV